MCVNVHKIIITIVEVQLRCRQDLLRFLKVNKLHDKISVPFHVSFLGINFQKIEFMVHK